MNVSNFIKLKSKIKQERKNYPNEIWEGDMVYLPEKGYLSWDEAMKITESGPYKKS